MDIKKIAVFSSNRSDYNKLEQIIKIISESKKLELMLFVYGSHMLSEFGNTKDNIKYKINAYISTDTESGDMIKSFTNGMNEFSTILTEMKPDAIVLHGDRYDVLSVAMIALLLNIYIIHIEGGELSGSIDEKIRHSISKLANLHFVSNKQSYNVLVQMGENPENIKITGCPSMNKIMSIKKDINILSDFNLIEKDYIIMTYHPNPLDIKESTEQYNKLLDEIIKINKKTFIFYPNIDTGCDDLVKILNSKKLNDNMFIIKDLTFDKYINLLYHCGIIVGNSSSIVREACIFGIPAILIGDRQRGRTISLNTSHIENIDDNFQVIFNNIYGVRFPPEYIYGNGNNKFIDVIKDTLENTNYKDISKSFIITN